MAQEEKDSGPEIVKAIRELTGAVLKLERSLSQELRSIANRQQ